jgi:uncharacterized protein YceK
MKNLSILSALCLALFIASGCSTTPEEKKAKEEQKEAYFEEGKMDDQVQSWKKPGGRY